MDNPTGSALGSQNLEAAPMGLRGTGRSLRRCRMWRRVILQFSGIFFPFHCRNQRNRRRLCSTNTHSHSHSHSDADAHSGNRWDHNLQYPDSFRKLEELGTRATQLCGLQPFSL